MECESRVYSLRFGGGTAACARQRRIGGMEWDGEAGRRGEARRGWTMGRGIVVRGRVYAEAGLVYGNGTQKERRGLL